MRKILSVIFSLLLICSLAVSASAAEGFIYCEAQDLITEELNAQHLTLGELARKTGVQMELYFMTCTDEPIPMDTLGEVLYENKEQQPEEYVAVLLQVGQDDTGWHLDETYPWDMVVKGTISGNKYFLNTLHTALDSLITQDNWSGPLEEDQAVATLTAAALAEAANQLYIEQSAPETPYVIDDARLLTMEQRQELNAYAEKITETYGMGIYVMAVDDFHNYGEEPQIYDVLWNYYQDNSLGCGAGRQGMILMLSMAERDFATFFYGEDTEYAFNGFGQAQLENYFLDDFGNDDWYNGFMGFLTASEDFMAKAAAGEPVRDNPWHLSAVFVLIALFASFVVTRLLWMKMANVAAQKGAARYQSAEGLVLTKQVDHFLTKTVRRRKIENADSGSGKSGSSRAHTGGGGSGRSGKF
ncbi:MAG: TPM domain-containing protein [Oscillospiraceae bacterium]|nr:TPM domain-containing protein [Oscillospiraceae bacterium]